MTLDLRGNRYDQKNLQPQPTLDRYMFQFVDLHLLDSVEFCVPFFDRILPLEEQRTLVDPFEAHPSHFQLGGLPIG
jgi:hypothetical protein